MNPEFRIASGPLTDKEGAKEVAQYILNEYNL